MIASGGVCAVLDYDIDLMTEYVAEMTQRLILPSPKVPSSLPEFVSDLLSSTRLPSTTILLGMHYLARRVNMFSTPGSQFVSEDSALRMLTIGLLLGSKFLDDNTFQNRSWSEVSGFPVADLNKLEAEWLFAMDYNIYVNLDENMDFNAWMANWEHWRKARISKPKSPLDLSTGQQPLGNNSQRVNPYVQAYKPRAQTVNPMDNSMAFNINYSKGEWAHSSHSYSTPPYLTPPSAPDSLLNTPVYMNMSATGVVPRYNDWANYESVTNHTYARGYQAQYHPSFHATQIAAYHTPVYQCSDFNYARRVWNNSPNCTPYGCYTCGDLRNLHAKNPPFYAPTLLTQTHSN
ncbi:BgTH12-03174 [Blumeria graminis f. sp. triticale]|uniref:Bgt-2319 n=3 Tax=Blumeria graminis TaxID=34373 RepID=A0A9X9QDU7_BLUGR|nr:Cyclin-like protein [Blumeria graminis f. sp. tritici 96224]CAD6503512.1 BgTH12-03174 [Blumeria graminis f. sp. triticale]VDB89615.1 Bgt-2319 [Blumeria graminis f. sp. tritici]